MKKTTHILFLSVLCLTLLVSASLAHAQNTASQTSEGSSFANMLQAQRDNMEQKLESEVTTKKEELSSAENDLKNKSSAEALSLVSLLQSTTADAQTAFIQKINTRVSTSFSRLNDIAYRIQSRMIKLQAAGADTSEAQKHLLKAETDLQALEKDFNSFDFSITGLADIEKDAAEIESVKTSLTNIQSEFEDTVTALETAQNNIQGAVAPLSSGSSSGNASH